MEAALEFFSECNPIDRRYRPYSSVSVILSTVDMDPAIGVKWLEQGPEARVTRQHDKRNLSSWLVKFPAETCFSIGLPSKFAKLSKIFKRVELVMCLSWQSIYKSVCQWSYSYHAPLAQWIRRLPTEQEILGSIPGGGIIEACTQE